MEITIRQQQIIDVSLEIIAESGIQGLTIKNLAKKIGFSEAAIYRHYENKINILVAILDYFKESTGRFFTKGLLSEQDAISKIELMLMNLFSVFTDSPSLVAVIFSEELFRNEVVLVKKMSEILSNNFTTMTTIIQAGQEKGEIRNDIEATHLSLLVLGALRLFVKQWQMTDYSFDLLKKGNELSNTIKTLLVN